VLIILIWLVLVLGNCTTSKSETSTILKKKLDFYFSNCGIKEVQVYLSDIRSTYLVEDTGPPAVTVFLVFGLFICNNCKGFEGVVMNFTYIRAVSLHFFFFLHFLDLWIFRYNQYNWI
jgi:hypothetical protein